MFPGHFAVGFAAKRFAPRASLGALIAAPLLLDLLWPLFLLAGVAFSVWLLVLWAWWFDRHRIEARGQRTRRFAREDRVK